MIYCYFLFSATYGYNCPIIWTRNFDIINGNQWLYVSVKPYLGLLMCDIVYNILLDLQGERDIGLFYYTGPQSLITLETIFNFDSIKYELLN